MDIKTLLFALALGNLCLCAALFFFDYGQRKSAAIAIAQAAKALQATGWLMLGLRSGGLIGDFPAVVFGYPFLFMGVAGEAGALWEAAGARGWRRPTALAVPLAVALFFALHALDAPALRAPAAALVLSACYLSASLALARHWTAASLLRRFIVVTMGVATALVAARGVLALLAPEGLGWLSAPVLVGLSLLAFYLLMLLTALGPQLLARESLQAELVRMAVLDPLTDVPNRRGFFQALSPWLALARRPGLPTALIVLDLDHFKRINDGYGLAAGDVVLRAVADQVRRQLRDSDLLGRLTGAEFALLLPRTELEAAVQVAERIRAAIAATPVKSERALIATTASLGVTTIRPDDSTVSLFKRADEALQTAKAAGRNRVEQARAPAPADAA